MAKKTAPISPIQREWTSTVEIDGAIQKLNRRLAELEKLNVGDDSACDVAGSNYRATIRDVFGDHSPEFFENQHERISASFYYAGMPKSEEDKQKENGKTHLLGRLRGLIG